MATRYLCIFYVGVTKMNQINKTNKRVVIIPIDASALTIENTLKIKYNAKYIKYIRNMDVIAVYYRNRDVEKMENINNLQLKDNE